MSKKPNKAPAERRGSGKQGLPWMRAFVQGYEANRHLVACINMPRMWGHRFAPKALYGIIKGRELGRDKRKKEAYIYLPNPEP